MVLEHLWDLPLNPLHHMNMGLLAYWPEKYLQPLLPLLHQLSLAHKPYLSSSHLTFSICHLPAHQIVLCPKSCCCCLSIFSNTSISIRIISPYTGLCPMNLNAPPGPPSLCCQQQVIFNQITGPNTSYFSPSQRYLLLLLPSLPIKPVFFFKSAQLAGKHDSDISYHFYCIPSLCQPFCCQLRGTGPLFFIV